MNLYVYEWEGYYEGATIGVVAKTDAHARKFLRKAIPKGTIHGVYTKKDTKLVTMVPVASLPVTKKGVSFMTHWAE